MNKGAGPVRGWEGRTAFFHYGPRGQGLVSRRAGGEGGIRGCRGGMLRMALWSGREQEVFGKFTFHQQNVNLSQTLLPYNGAATETEPASIQTKKEGIPT